MKYLIAGLGNIGAEYAHTRHNIGFDVVQAFVQQQGGAFAVERLGAVAHVKVKGRQLVCLQPSTYMNLSGKAVRYWLDKEGIAVENMLVIMDDLALPLSRLRLRGSGSHAGHNGLRSIEETLGTTEYPRLRFGIGNDFPRGRQVEFVLGRWTEEEEPLVQAKIKRSVTAIEEFALVGLSRAMNLVNNTEISL
ncbi:MAG TPA: aminoacyl-tRNA hydrolase [Lacibacter sp.]|nr:aminoacyl-tRNA hydrolase [Lacibacter sp.]HMO89235.1 aminoacyl-tRNA hydrolase [Lacibacter sp.]